MGGFGVHFRVHGAGGGGGAGEAQGRHEQQGEGQARAARARERAENAAKEKIDKLNLMALNKIKHQKLAEKANKNNEAEKQAVMEKHQEKLKAAKFRKD